VRTGARPCVTAHRPVCRRRPPTDGHARRSARFRCATVPVGPRASSCRPGAE